jgi:hypothetical protein
MEVSTIAAAPGGARTPIVTVTAPGLTAYRPDVDAARQHLRILGIDPPTARLRSIPAVPGRGGGAREWVGLAGDGSDLQRAAAAGHGVYVVVGHAPTIKGRATADADVVSIGSLFVEWDDQPLDWQRQAWIELGLPEPTLMMATGGKSLHLYWRLAEPAEPKFWQQMQDRLIAHCRSDKWIRNPGRVMRLAGSVYLSKTSGEATGVATIDAAAPDAAYSLATFDDLLPPLIDAPQQRIVLPDPPTYSLSPRPLADVESALRCIPAFLPHNGERDLFRAFVWSLRAAVREAGGDDALTLALLQGHSPAVTDAAQYLRTEAHSVGPGTFWRMATQHGWGPATLTLRAAPPPAAEGGADFDHTWQQFEAAADHAARQPWPAMKAAAFLTARCAALGLRCSRSEVDGMLHAAQRRLRPAAAPLQPGTIASIPGATWAVDGLCRHGLNLLVGAPGSGKSRLAAAAAAAWIRGDRTWLDRAMPAPTDERHVLIVGTDQPLSDWRLTLEPVGLMACCGPTEVRLHDRVTLHPLETATILDADGLAIIRRWCDAHPGGMVVVDSLSASLPPGIDEDKAAAARPVHALAEAIGGCWALLLHHTRKSAGRDGNLGVGAGRGSGAIDAAVSRVIGLGLIHKMQDGVMVAQESDPRREFISTKRGGPTAHLVIASDGNGAWTCQGSAEDLQRSERRERTLARLTEPQADVLAALGDGWCTARQVCETLHPDATYAPHGAAAAAVRKILRRLETLALIEGAATGRERSFRARELDVSHVSRSRTDEGQMTGSHGSHAAAQGISLAHMPAHTGSHRLTAAGGEPACEPVCEDVSRCEPPHVSHQTPVAAACEPCEPVPPAHTGRVPCLLNGMPAERAAAAVPGARSVMAFQPPGAPTGVLVDPAHITPLPIAADDSEWDEFAPLAS